MTNTYNLRKKTSQLVGALIVLFGTLNLSAQVYTTVPYSTGFESGLDPAWTTTSSLTTGEITIITSGTLTWSTQTALSHTGTKFLGMHHPATGNGAYNLNEAKLHLDLAGQSNLRFSAWWAEWNDETEAQDGIYISSNGGTSYVKVVDLPGASYADLTYVLFDMSLDSINAVHGLTFTSNYIIKFQQYDNYYLAGGNDGHLYDDISVYSTCGTSSTIAPTVCSTYTVPSGSATYTSSGTYTDTLVNSAGCDSIITINLSVNSSTSTLSPVACTSYTVPSGTATYTSTGTYMDTIPNSAGCDSIITINLTMGNNSSTITEIVCDSYTIPSGTATHTSSGTYTDVIPNAAGCDSVITINLTVNSSYSTSITEIACDTYTAPDMMVYNASGIYTSTLTNASGCDSIIVVDLTVNSSSSSTITETALDVYTAPSGAIYTTSGTYVDIIPNASGCDSTITIDLTVAYTGLEELTTSTIKLFPNPTSGLVSIEEMETLDIEELFITDNKGASVLTLDKNDKSFDISKLSAGVYYLNIQLVNRVERHKLVKQ